MDWEIRRMARQFILNEMNMRPKGDWGLGKLLENAVPDGKPFMKIRACAWFFQTIQFIMNADLKYSARLPGMLEDMKLKDGFSENQPLLNP